MHKIPINFLRCIHKLNKHKIIFYRKAIKDLSPNVHHARFGCESTLHKKPLNQLCISIDYRNIKHTLR